MLANMLDSMRYCFLTVLVLAFLLINAVWATSVGVATIRAPAVILGNNTGALTTINLTVTYGNGSVKVVGPSEVGISTVQSADTAARYATAYLNLSFQNYDFTYNITDLGANVSGPSAGAAMTLLAISALVHKPLRQNFTITGTISEDGSIGAVGGVYDKVSAASSDNVKIMLVPSVGAGSEEDILYLLAQSNFGVPLVQVSNISSAARYAFNRNLSGTANETHYNFYTNYSVNKIPGATLTCNNNCNESAFEHLAGTTLNYTALQIRTLGSNPKFKGIAAQLGDVLNESRIVVQGNYLYTGADLAFLNYVDVFYLSNYNTSIGSGLQVLLGTHKYCAALVPPTMTNSNYEYLLGAELRQLWANYTINTTIAAYNTTNIDTDEVLDSMYSAAQATGWCRAAGTIYASPQIGYGEQVQPSKLLEAVALERINRAQTYGPSMYLDTAQIAYKQGNYSVAILDADYAYAIIGMSAGTGNETSAQIASNASALLSGNATYGVWATEFAKEALFYINESRLASNSTLAHSYALQAYSSAALAQSIGSDMQMIYQSLMPSSASQGINGSAAQISISMLNNMIFILLALLILIAILVAVNVILLALSLKARRPVRKRAGRRGRNARRR
jgi:predicted S18 family serine protease